MELSYLLICTLNKNDNIHKSEAEEIKLINEHCQI